uniref:Protein kinase domain-containing protein n=1 Tax=Leersia perrieri TaxID=77586 RepID=A0A0D9XQ82_9ORYZ
MMLSWRAKLLQVLLVGGTLLSLAASTDQRVAAIETPITLPGCTDKCGNISIPFPFGMKQSRCFLPGFEVTCNDTFSPPRLFLGNYPQHRPNYQEFVQGYYSMTEDDHPFHLSSHEFLFMELISIDLNKGVARAYGPVSSDCNVLNETYHLVKKQMTGLTEPFLISTRNVLTAIGWSFEAILSRSVRGSGYLKSCNVRLSQPEHATNVSCLGGGCCLGEIIEGIASIAVSFVQQNNSLWGPNPCSYGMVVEKNWYNFTSPDLYSYTFPNKYPRGVPLLIDFAIRDELCPAPGQVLPANYSCVSSNSSCANVTNGNGYICNCRDVYHGNPYIPNGCHDIDECSLRDSHPEFKDVYPCSRNEICMNRPGGYDCPCRQGMRGDGKTGTCTDKFPLEAKVVVGAIGGLFIIAVLVFLALLHRQKKKMREFFEKNGGPILEKVNNIKIFKKEELKPILKASNIIGKGGFGEVYKGHFADSKQQVAVKKSINVSAEQKEQFANEIIIQSRVIHKNIVKLIGCCLEVDIPMLVYEFITNGSLHDILHGSNGKPLSLDIRLDIAAESAEGLAYMHSKTNSTILHGDIKPANILLDDNFVPKISDFGISRLIAIDKKQHTDYIIGDKSYMDPVYLQTGLLTKKSDVYSYGVVLLELISRKKATYSDNNSLIRNFLDAHKEKRIATELFDNDITEKAEDLELLDSLVRIAVECLNLDVDQRPEMTDVEERLVILKRSRAR